MAYSFKHLELNFLFIILNNETSRFLCPTTAYTITQNVIFMMMLLYVYVYLN